MVNLPRSMTEEIAEAGKARGMSKSAIVRLAWEYALPYLRQLPAVDR
jgi:hypothetical protein